MLTKKCSSCKEAKPRSEFWKNASERDGLQSRCKPCINSYNRAWNEKHPEKNRAYNQTWRDRNLEKNRARMRRVHRKSWLPGEHEKAEARRPFVTECACCESNDPFRKTGWIADHDHRIGRFRDYVCQPCNLVIGYIEQGHFRPEFYPQQVVYIQRFQSR